MPNKTIYVRESDLRLLQGVQAESGQSISSLFAEFLRERMDKMDAFVHVLHSKPPRSGGEPEFVVFIAPVGPTGSGGSRKPNYVRGGTKLVAFLEEIGLTPVTALEIASKLRRAPSVSERVYLSRLAVQQF
jgi:hypothetical protein